MNQLGVEVVDGQMQVNNTERQILQLVEREYREGSSAARIAFLLNEGGFRNRRGNKFSRQNVEHYIRTYIRETA